MANSILAWNEVALEANRVSHTEVDKREQNEPTLSTGRRKRGTEINKRSRPDNSRSEILELLMV